MSCHTVNNFANDGCGPEIQDKVCISIDCSFNGPDTAAGIAAVGSQTIYSSNLFLTASGYVSHLQPSVHIRTIAVHFLLNQHVIHTLPSLSAGASVAFTVANFDKIIIELEDPQQLPPQTSGFVNGEFSLTPRYR